MWTGPQGGVEPEQVKVHTVSLDSGTIHVHTGHEAAKIEILDGEKVVAEGFGCEVDIRIPDAKLWSAETPNLYSCKVTVAGDEAVVVFGIRTISWDNRGFYVNKKPILLRGGCVHHDNGILGAASPDEANYRRAKKLKEAGFTAIRSAHNPISRAMIEA